MNDQPYIEHAGQDGVNGAEEGPALPARLPIGSPNADPLEEIRLLGQPPLQDHLSFVRNCVVDSDAIDMEEIATAWREANDYYHELEQQEAGFADDIEILDLDPSLDPLVEAIEKDPRFTYTFDTFPTDIALVELDRLVVYQTHVTRPFTDGLRTRLGTTPDAETLFRFCQPSATAETPIDIRKIGRRRFMFSSESTDFRSHEPALLHPNQVSDHKTFGPMSAVVGLPVGFGSNFFTAIQHEDRVLLHNGYHRAYAMRALGITHAPCIIQTVTRRDELEVAAKESVADNPGFYFGAKRPPILKDFFDPRIAQSFMVYRTVKMIEVNFEIRTFEVQA